MNDRQMTKQSARELDAFIHDTLTSDGRARLRVKPLVSVGDPADEIVRIASSRRADLIVLGTRGLSGPRRLLLGSTTLGVLQRTAAPVLAVPWRGDAPAPAVPPTWPDTRIVAPIELGGDAARDVDAAAAIAEWFGVSLLLLHVVEPVAAPGWLTGDASGHDRVRVAQATAQIDALGETARRRVETETRVVCGHVADQVAALAASDRIPLLITALRERRGWFGARRGSVSYHVLSHAVAPVLACPPRWRAR